MKKLYTLKDLKKKYNPDKVIAQIEENFVPNMRHKERRTHWTINRKLG